MKILVTGGHGGVGRAVVQRLVQHGHMVRILDRATQLTTEEAEGVESVAGDLTQFANVRDSVRGMEAVIHLAALTYPGAGPAHEIYHINVSGTFNVYEAAAQEGIRRVVSASSINALGYNFGVRPFQIQYLPMDEAHPSYTTDAYSFSKENLESIASYYWRREHISGVQLRLPFVYTARPGFRDMMKRMSGEVRAALPSVLQRPEAELRLAAEKSLAHRAEMRAGRISELSWDKRPAPPPSSSPMDPAMMLGFSYTDFWAAIGGEDAAQAFENGVTASYEGSHPLYVCERENSIGAPSALLARLFFPDTEMRRELVGLESLVSTERAAALIGFAPTGNMRTWLNSE